MADKEIRVIHFPANGQPKLITIKDELGEYQRLIGGHIETYRLKSTGLLALMDEDGWNKQLKPHCHFEFFLGDLVFVGTSGEEFASVTDEDVRRFERNYEVRVQEEVH